MKKAFTFALALLAAASAWAYDFKAGDLYYNITDEAAKTVEVTYEKYQSSSNYSSLPSAVTIPETVSYNGTTYCVTSIGESAFYYCKSFTEITIPNSLKSIGNGAFVCCESLTEVTIPNSVTSIGTSAFAYCEALTKISISNTVTSIGESAFEGCSTLTQITIPNSVESIGNGVFSGCYALTQVTIGNGLTSIGDYAFIGCYALMEINVDEANNAYYSENGILFNKNKTTLIQYPLGKAETIYTIPDGVVNIGNYVFYGCDMLISVIIPNGVKNIGNYAFYACSELTQVTIGNNVTSIGKSAFADCSKLTTVNWNAINYYTAFNYGYTGPFKDSPITNLIFSDQVEYIPARICYEMSTLTKVTIGNGVTSIGDDAFWSCSALTAVYYTGDVAGWCGITFAGFNSNPLYYAHNLYIGNTLVTRLNIPDGINEIKDYTFLGCDALRQTTIPNSVTSIGDYSFCGCNKLTQVTIGNNIKIIGERAFLGCSALTQVTLPDKVTSIGNEAFRNCSALTQVTIPNSVTSIGSLAFYGCSALTQVTIGNSVTSIGDNAFYSCSALMQVTIGSGVTSIGNSAFYGCSALAEMTVLATVPPTVGVDAFYNVSRSIPVYVPAEALEDYWAAEVWEEFYYLQAIPANALHTPSMPESISVYDGMLHNPQQLPVSIYDMQGRMVYSGTAATVSQPAGVYVVRCAGASGKVLF